jgi:hypothetical protein
MTRIIDGSSVLAEHGEWTKQTQREIESILGDECDTYFALIHSAAAGCAWALGEGRNRADIEGDVDYYAGPGPKDFLPEDEPMRSRIIDAAFIVASDPVFAGLAKVRSDYLGRKYKEFKAGRRAAAAAIDIETCDYWSQHVDSDPYRFFGGVPDCVGRERFVFSQDSGGPIHVGDLSKSQREALDARIDRERKSTAA